MFPVHEPEVLDAMRRRAYTVIGADDEGVVCSADISFDKDGQIRIGSALLVMQRDCVSRKTFSLRNPSGYELPIRIVEREEIVQDILTRKGNQIDLTLRITGEF